MSRSPMNMEGGVIPLEAGQSFLMKINEKLLSCYSRMMTSGGQTTDLLLKYITPLTYYFCLQLKREF